MGDGDFCGPIKGGYATSLLDYTAHKLQRAWDRYRAKCRSTLYSGFASLSDLISEATAGGKRQDFMYAKTGVTGVANVANGLYDVGVNPPAMTDPADNQGENPTNAKVGAIPFTSPTGGDTLHFTGATAVATVANNNLLLHDLYHRYLHNLANDLPTVSLAPSRYQSDAAKGTFINMCVETALGAGTPTYRIEYVDQGGSSPEYTATQTVVGSAIARRFPFAATVGNGWFFPLNSGDTGVRSITNLDLSATSTGKVFVNLCKPYVWIPQPVANQAIIVDGINSAFNLVQIADDACLSFLEICKGATTATSYNGQLIFVAG